MQEVCYEFDMVQCEAFKSAVLNKRGQWWQQPLATMLLPSLIPFFFAQRRGEEGLDGEEAEQGSHVAFMAFSEQWED